MNEVRSYTKEAQTNARVSSKMKRKRKSKVGYLKQTAQNAVNAYVRQRDEGKPCVSCNQTHTKGGIPLKLQAGHYIAQGSSGIHRYDTQNIHGQCLRCNMFMNANLEGYRPNIVKKIGLKEVERLEAQRHDTKSWSRSELIYIKDYYKKLMK